MKIIVVGGGTAGWLAAYCLCKSQPGQHDITVIESSAIGIIGAGEGTLGSMHDLVHGDLFPFKIDEEDFIKKTDATNKMGIYHRFWDKEKHEYYAPLAGGPTAKSNCDFIFKYAFQKYGYDKFHVASQDGLHFEEKYYDNYRAYHVDGHKVGAYFKDLCLKDNVQILDSVVEQVNLNELGHVKSLSLDNGSILTGDFFFDCTGFKRILMNAVDSKWISYKKYLPVDTAMPFILKYKEGEIPLPMTTATAMSSGWMWNIPLKSRRGCGYVFDSKFISREDAQKEVEELLGMPIEPIKFINFTSGRSSHFWKNNVLALGLSSCFVEPLEATSIHSTIAQTMCFIDEFLLPNSKNTVTKENEAMYNNVIASMYETIFNFISLHYQGGREDTAFWRHIKDNKIVTDYTKMIIEKSKNKILSAWMFDYSSRYAADASLWNWIMAGLRIITPEQARRELIEFNQFNQAENYWTQYVKSMLN
jgi:tryptophan halogenase